MKGWRTMLDLMTPAQRQRFDALALAHGDQERIAAALLEGGPADRDIVKPLEVAMEAARRQAALEHEVTR